MHLNPTHVVVGGLIGIAACTGGGGTACPDGSTPDANGVCVNTDADADADADADTDSDTDSDTDTDADTDTTPEVCGDGTCAPGEGATSCCADCGVCTEDGRVEFSTGYADGGQGSGVTPGGMAAAYTSFTAGTYTTLVFPFTVVEEPIDDADYFWAQQFYPDGGNGGYLGLQAHGLIDGAWAGKIAIFSVWDSLSATAGPDASCETFGGEGVGWSCRMAFDWQPDTTYTFTLTADGAGSVSVDLWDPRAAATHRLGTIAVPDTWGKLEKDTVAFAEYFGSVRTCEETPWARVWIHAPSADGAAPRSMSAVTYGDCATAAAVTCTGKACR